MNEIQRDILELLQHVEGGLNAYKVAKGLKLRIQKVTYHLKEMVKSGLIYREQMNGLTIYHPQPVFVNRDLMRSLEKDLGGLLGKIWSASYIDPEADPTDAALAILDVVVLTLLTTPDKLGPVLKDRDQN